MRNEDVFPHDDPAARFMLAMWAVRNDLEYVMSLIGPANYSEAPEFTYLIRLAISHLYEGTIALGHYERTFPAEIDSLLAALPTDGRRAMNIAKSAATQGGALEFVRNQSTFHYPSPDGTFAPTSDRRLQGVLENRKNLEFERYRTVPVPRLPLADEALVLLAFGRHAGVADNAVKDEAKFRRQVEQTVKGTAAFRNFVLHLWQVYCDGRTLQ